MLSSGQDIPALVKASFLGQWCFTTPALGGVSFYVVNSCTCSLVLPKMSKWPHVQDASDASSESRSSYVGKGRRIIVASKGGAREIVAVRWRGGKFSQMQKLPISFCMSTLGTRGTKI